MLVFVTSGNQALWKDYRVLIVLANDFFLYATSSTAPCNIGPELILRKELNVTAARHHSLIYSIIIFIVRVESTMTAASTCLAGIRSVA